MNLQMMSYDDQLEFKQKVVDKAFRNFSCSFYSCFLASNPSLTRLATALSLEMLPIVLPTIASPSVYGYRTKITTHFDVPPKKKTIAKDEKVVSKKPWELRIGFAEKGRQSVMDIEVY